MDIRVFNLGLLLGWLLVSVGASMLHIGGGLVASGLLAICLVLFIASRAGVVKGE